MHHEHEDWQEPPKEENEVEILMENIDAAQHAAVTEEEEEEKRRKSPNRAKPSFEVLNEKERYWEKPENKD